MDVPSGIGMFRGKGLDVMNKRSRFIGIIKRMHMRYVLGVRFKVRAVGFIGRKTVPTSVDGTKLAAVGFLTSLPRLRPDKPHMPVGGCTLTKNLGRIRVDRHVVCDQNPTLLTRNMSSHPLCPVGYR